MVLLPTGAMGFFGLLAVIVIGIAVVAIVGAVLWYTIMPVGLHFLEKNVAMWKAYVPVYNIYELLKIYNIQAVFWVWLPLTCIGIAQYVARNAAAAQSEAGASTVFPVMFIMAGVMTVVLGVYMFIKMIAGKDEMNEFIALYTVYTPFVLAILPMILLIACAVAYTQGYPFENVLRAIGL